MKKFKQVIINTSAALDEIRSLSEGKDHCFMLDSRSGKLLKFADYDTAVDFREIAKNFDRDRGMLIGKVIAYNVEVDLRLDLTDTKDILNLAERMKHFYRPMITREEFQHLNTTEADFRDFINARGVAAF